MERQVRKYKTRVNRKHRDRGDQDIFVAEVQESTTNNHADDIESENDIEIIRSKQFSLKPMDSEEAVLQMNLLGHDFFILPIEKLMAQALFIDEKMANTV